MELKSSEKLAINYHDIFDYPLTSEELFRWSSSKILRSKKYFFVKGRNLIIKKRLQNEKYSRAKLKIAKSASELIGKIPTVKFVGITGALAMMNAGKDSDIDLMIVTKANTLWTTRLLCYWSLVIGHWSLRRPRNKNEKDMLCLNLWLDESDLKWDVADRNLYTAHEIAQVVPLVNKDKTYERFIFNNKWILNYWPNSVRIRGYKEKVISPDSSFLSSILLILEQFVFKLQYLYMKPKITREVVSKTRAIFHPNDWGKVVISKLSS